MDEEQQADQQNTNGDIILEKLIDDNTSIQNIDFRTKEHYLSFIAGNYFFNISANSHAYRLAIVFYESLPNLL